MAVFQFQQAAVELTYIAGQEQDGAAIYKKSTLRHVKESATADQLASVAQAIASLSSFTLSEVVKVQKQTIL